MFYLKRNLPGWERGARLALAALVTGAAASGWVTGLLAWGVWATAITLGLTAVVGFCPACAMAGRQPAKD